MNSDHSSSLHTESAAKKAYSAPQVTDIGAIGELALGGSGVIAENMSGGPNMMKHP